MSRPMPEPPAEVELYRERWIRKRSPWRIWWRSDDGTEGDLSLRYALRRTRLTDAECAAEYWHAFVLYWTTNEGAPYANRSVEARRAATWHRFATHPHAVKEAPNQGAFSFEESE